MTQQEQPKDNGQQTAQQQDNKTFCPCCGQRTFNKHTKIQDNLLNHYLACMMTGTQFWRDYELYDGKLRIRATIPAYSRLKDIQVLLGQLRARVGTPQGAELSSMFTELQFVLRRLLSIQEIQIRDPNGMGNRVIKRTYDIVVNALKQGLQGNGDWQKLKAALTTAYTYVRDAHTGVVVPFQLLSSVADAHALIYSTITSAGLDENFWQGIKLS